MPTGIHEGPVHCKKCNGKAFKTVSDLRKHQWKDHPDSFAKLREKLTGNGNLNKVARKEIARITAEELLSRLKVRRDFMNDIVALVEGIMNEK